MMTIIIIISMSIIIIIVINIIIIIVFKIFIKISIIGGDIYLSLISIIIFNVIVIIIIIIIICKTLWMWNMLANQSTLLVFCKASWPFLSYQTLQFIFICICIFKASWPFLYCQTLHLYLHLNLCVFVFVFIFVIVFVFVEKNLTIHNVYSTFQQINTEACKLHKMTRVSR